MDSVLLALNISPYTLDTPMLKRESVAIPVAFYGDSVGLVEQRLDAILMAHGYVKKKSIETGEGQKTLIFCHDQTPHRFVTWGKSHDAQKGWLIIHAEGVPKNILSCD